MWYRLSAVFSTSNLRLFKTFSMPPWMKYKTKKKWSIWRSHMSLNSFNIVPNLKVFFRRIHLPWQQKWASGKDKMNRSSERARHARGDFAPPSFISYRTSTMRWQLLFLLQPSNRWHYSWNFELITRCHAHMGWCRNARKSKDFMSLMVCCVSHQVAMTFSCHCRSLPPHSSDPQSKQRPT